MIGMRTILEVADNSGARRLSVILARAAATSSFRAGLGDVVTAAVKEAGARFGDQEGQSGLKLRCRPDEKRRLQALAMAEATSGSTSNAAVLINDVGEPIGTRVIGRPGGA